MQISRREAQCCVSEHWGWELPGGSQKLLLQRDSAMSQPQGQAAQPRAVGLERALVLFSQSPLLGWEPGSGPSTLRNFTKQQASPLCCAPDVCLAPSPSQPTPMTARLSPESRNSWSAERSGSPPLDAPFRMPGDLSAASRPVSNPEWPLQPCIHLPTSREIQ